MVVGIEEGGEKGGEGRLVVGENLLLLRGKVSMYTVKKT
jgi:hypothetical protein